MPCRVRTLNWNVLTWAVGRMSCLHWHLLIHGRSDWIGPEFRPLSCLRDINKVEGTPLVQGRGSAHKREQIPHLTTTAFWQTSYTVHDAPCSANMGFNDWLYLHEGG